MAEASIPVDLFNPGQVFACLGFMDAAETLLGGAAATFDWSDSTETRFVLAADGAENPFEHVLRFLASAEVVAVAPTDALLSAWKPGWGRVERLGEDEPYPCAEPGSPATLIAVLRNGERALVLDHWGDVTRRDAVKFWGGARGYPGAALARDALQLVRERCVGAAGDPFALAASQSSSFRLDWRRDYIPIDAGFSLNAHPSINPVGYPLVELLGALGLGNARPERVSRLAYRYAVIGRPAGAPLELYPPLLLRAALGNSELPFPTRRFHMSLGSPGKEGQARAITTVIEETA